jgi:3'-5' exoribonuclease
MKLFMKDMVPDERISACFVLGAMELRESRNKKPYLLLSLSDKTGTIKGFLWNNPVQTAAFLKGKTFVKVYGTTKMLNGGLIINVKNIGIARKDEIGVVPSIQMNLFNQNGITGRHEGAVDKKEVAA